MTTTPDEKDPLVTPESATNENTPVESVAPKAVSSEEEAKELADETQAAEVFQTKEEVLDRLRALVEHEVNTDRAELDRLKHTYYKLQKAEILAAREAFVEAGGEAEAFVPNPDTKEETLRGYLDTLKTRRAKLHEALEQAKQENLKRKEAIIERIKEIAVTADSADKHFDEFKNLQAEWREIKQVPAEKATELWESYRFQVELFYDQLHQNHESRAYDFKKNLEAKTALCEAAEKLAEAADVVAAFNQLQQLHAEYRETGPVEKEQREQIWTRFKAASTVVNKRHTDYFAALKAQQQENYDKKVALCERVEAIAEAATQETKVEWEKLSQSIIDIQGEWKGIGFAPKKVNTEVYERFRAACDKFFGLKSEYYKTQRNELAENLKKKQSLIEQAEALKDSTDWAATTNKLVELQKAWKEIGAVAHKHSDAVWKRFQAACNHFFDRKAQETAGQQQEEAANLEAKRNIIEALKKVLEEKADDAQEQVRELMAKWRETGFVPFRQKDKINKAYKQVVDNIFDELNMKQARRNFDNFRKSISDKVGSELDRQRDRLYRAYEAKRAEIKTFETNLAFLTTKSKSGNSLLDEMNRNVEKLRKELDLLREKIEAVDTKKNEDAQNPSQEEQAES